MKRDYFLNMGGYKDLPFMEDVDLMRRVKKRGGRICFIDKKVKTSSRRWKKEGILYPSELDYHAALPVRGCPQKACKVVFVTGSPLHYFAVPTG